MKIYHRTFQIGPVIETRRGDGPAKYSGVLTTGAPIRRQSWLGERLIEVLSMAPGAVDLSRSPFPLLVGHNTRELPIGLVDNVRVIGNELLGEITFGTSTRAKEVQAAVDEGVARSISIGYSRDKVIEAREERGDETTITITATKWSLYEASVVSVPAVPAAGFRGDNIHQEREMDPEVLAALGLPPDTTREQYLAAIRALNQRATAADTDRRAELRQSALERGLFTLGSDRERLFNAAAERDVGEARALAETWASSPAVPVGGPVGSFMQSRSYPDPDQPARSRGSYRAGGRGDDYREAVVDALCLRAGIKIKDPHPASADVDASPRGIAATLLSRAGVTVSDGDNLEGMIRRSFSTRDSGYPGQATGDFSAILIDAMNVASRVGYEVEPSTHRAWVGGPHAVSDFRLQHRVILGSAPSYLPVGEGGEYEMGVFSDDAAVPYKAVKHGRIVAFTLEMMLADSLGSTLRVLPGLGQAARRLEADLTYNHLLENSGAGPVMQSGENLFDAAHDNIAIAGEFNAALLGRGRLLLRKQQAVGNGGYLGLVPRVLLVPAERESEAELLIARSSKHLTGSFPGDAGGATSGLEASTPRWIANDLILVVESRLPDDVVYLIADSRQIDSIEMALLAESMSGPVFFEEQGFSTDTIRYKSRHSVGVRALDFRGMVKCPITDPS